MRPDLRGQPSQVGTLSLESTVDSESHQFLVESRLFASSQLSEHRGESPDVGAERGKEFLICALHEVDELACEAATRRRWS